MRKQIPLATVDSHLNLKGWWKYEETKQKKEVRIKLTCDVRWKASSKTPTTATHSFFMMEGILFFLVEKTWMEQETKPLLFLYLPVTSSTTPKHLPLCIILQQMLFTFT